MRILLLALIATLQSIFAIAQTPSSDVSSSRRMIPMTSLPPEEIKDDIQGKFLRQEWTLAIVSFRNSPKKWYVPLLFDVYSNKAYFLHENQIMEFVDTVSEFTMMLARRYDSIKVKFRSFYPAIHQNTPEIFYEVLVDGKFQLLRCRAKTVYQFKEQDIPEDQRRYNKELLYAFFPNKQIVLIKKDKEQLLGQVPSEYSEQIRSIIESKKIKVKNEEGLKQLFRLLNERE